MHRSMPIELCNRVDLRPTGQTRQTDRINRELTGQGRYEIPLQDRLEECVDLSMLVVTHSAQELVDEMNLLLGTPGQERLQSGRSIDIRFNQVNQLTVTSIISIDRYALQPNQSIDIQSNQSCIVMMIIIIINL